MANRFFVTIIAPDKRTLLRLRKHDFDVFQATASINEQQETTIEGLLTLEEIGKLVEDGYRVVVEEEASKRDRAKSVGISFEDWLKGMEE